MQPHCLYYSIDVHYVLQLRTSIEGFLASEVHIHATRKSQEVVVLVGQEQLEPTRFNVVWSFWSHSYASVRQSLRISQ